MCRTLRLIAAGVSDELRRLLHQAGFNLPPLYLRLVAPMNDPKALALLPLKVGGGVVLGAPVAMCRRLLCGPEVTVVACVSLL